MFGDAPEWFGVVLSGFMAISLHGYHALVVTLASPYLEVALSGCLLFLQLFLEGGYEKIFFLVGHSYACSKTFVKHIIGKPFK